MAENLERLRTKGAGGEKPHEVEGARRSTAYYVPGYSGVKCGMNSQRAAPQTNR